MVVHRISSLRYPALRGRERFDHPARSLNRPCGAEHRQGWPRIAACVTAKCAGAEIDRWRGAFEGRLVTRAARTLVSVGHADAGSEIDISHTRAYADDAPSQGRACPVRGRPVAVQGVPITAPQVEIGATRHSTVRHH